MTAGIYRIQDRKERIYIGSAIDIKGRWNKHKSLLRSNKHRNLKLQNTYNKHGIDYFTFDIVEVVEDVNNLIAAEQKHLDILFATMPKRMIYNVCRIAYSTLGIKHIGRKLSEEHKRKISVASKGRVMSEEAKSKIRAANIGKKRGPRSGETKTKISTTKRGKKNKPMSEEGKRNISNASKGRPWTQAQRDARIKENI